MRVRMTAVFALALLMLLPGCKKKTPAAPPPQAQPPTATEPEPQQATPPETEPAPTEPAPEITPPPTTPPPPTTEPPKKPSAAKPKPNATVKKSEPPPKKPPKVVEEGGAPETLGQLSAGGSHSKMEHQRANTVQLLDATEANLKSLTRALSSDEQVMVQQIRNYVRQSRDATTQGDNERAYNLALKAHLLSDELSAKR